MSVPQEPETASICPIADDFPGASAQVVADLLRVAHRLRSVLNAQLSQFSLNDVRFSVLKIVEQAAPEGCSQAELAKELDQWESSISTLVDRMRESHLLHRLQAKSDRRKRVLVVSEQGRELLKRAERARQQQVDLLFRQFSEQQQQFLSTHLELLLAELAPFEVPIKISETSTKPFQPPMHQETAGSPAILPAVPKTAGGNNTTSRDDSPPKEHHPAA